MNKSELINNIAAEAKISLKDADKAYKAFVETVKEALKSGEGIALAGFGTFKVRKRAARMGINPQTKQKIRIPAMKVPAFKFGKAFREMLK